MGVVSRPGLEFFYFMLTTQKSAAYSKKSLESCTELIQDLIDGSTDFHKTFMYLEEAMKKVGGPIDMQRMSELKDLWSVSNRQLLIQKAELEFQISQLEAKEEVDAALKQHIEKAKEGRRAQS